jgi:hypothetical protein
MELPDNSPLKLKPYKDNGVQFHAPVSKLDLEPQVVQSLVEKTLKNNRLTNRIVLQLLKTWQFYAVSALIVGAALLIGK